MTLFIAALVIWALPGGAAAETRALVIAADYTGAANTGLKLANPLADARMVATALGETSVDSVLVLEEPDVAVWDESFDTFADSLELGDIAIFYYAGHGFQIGGTNYLLAADGTSLVALSPLVNQLSERAKGVIVVVDACRDNPLAPSDAASSLSIIERGGKARSIETVTLNDLGNVRTGLAQLSDLRGLSAVVLFSTEPGNVAEDGDNPGLGSLFARIFSREIKQRQSLNSAIRNISVGVNRATDRRQSPWRQGDLPFDVFVAGMRSLPIP